jgi:hypothetical protein
MAIASDLHQQQENAKAVHIGEKSKCRLSLRESRAAFGGAKGDNSKHWKKRCLKARFEVCP